MKKLVSLILALVMVLACSVAMAEPAKKGSAKDFEELPEFFEPIGMKTKRGGDTVTVTLDGEVDALYVLWYNWDKELGCYVVAPEELEVVDGVAKYNAAGHKYQPGVYGAPMDISFGPYSQVREDNGWVTFANKFNALSADYYMAGNGLVEDVWNSGAGRTVPPTYYFTELNTTERNQPTTYLPVANENDYFVMYNRATNTIVTSYAEARKAIANVLNGSDEYKYIDIYDYRVSGRAQLGASIPAITARTLDDLANSSSWSGAPKNGHRLTDNGYYADDVNKSTKYWTLEKVYDVIDGEAVVGFKIIQPWGVKVESHDLDYGNSEGGAYMVVVGDVAIFYDRAGNWIYEEITDTGDPFGVGEEGTVIYTYTKMKAKSNERYWLSKVEVTYEEGDIAMIYQRFLPNAGKSGLALHIFER